MDSQKLDKFRDILSQKEREVEHTIEQMKENETGEQNKYSSNELSSYDNHPGDLGTELFLTEFNNALKVHEEHIIKDIHDAFNRMESGTYGICAFCGNEIAEERLEVIPYARLCIDCERDKAINPSESNADRPVEEEIWDAPFGRKYLNKREDDEYEGLDYLNDLMKFGSADTPQDMGGYHDYDEFYTNEIDNQGIVDDMDKVSNEEYKKQLPD